MKTETKDRLILIALITAVTALTIGLILKLKIIFYIGVVLLVTPLFSITEDK